MNLYYINKKNKKGYVLMESLIGMFLLFLMGLIPMKMLSDSRKLQREINIQTYVLEKMRNILFETSMEDLCNTSVKKYIEIGSPTQTNIGTNYPISQREKKVTVNKNFYKKLDLDITCVPKTNQIYVNNTIVSLENAPTTLKNVITLKVTDKELFSGDGVLELTQ